MTADTTPELLRAANRLLRHYSARCDGKDPYRQATPHDPSTSHLFDHDRFQDDVRLVASFVLATIPREP